MSVNINADTTNGLVMTSDTSGEIKLQSADTDIVSVTANGIDVTGDFTVDTTTLHVDATNNRVGIGTSSPLGYLTVKSQNRVITIGDSGTNNVAEIKATNTTDTGSAFLRLNSYDLDIHTGATPARTMRVDNNGNLYFNSGYGSAATAYGCRAWVKFKGTGTVTINGSGNVSSITDEGTGRFRVNFSTAMPDTNYSVATVTSTDGSTDRGATSLINDTVYSTTQLRILVWNGSGYGDQVNNCVQIFR